MKKSESIYGDERNGMEANHCKILEQSLNGERKVDEQTFDSLEILGERLERLKKNSLFFGKISFSPAVEQLAKSRHAMAVG